MSHRPLFRLLAVILSCGLFTSISHPQANTNLNAGIPGQNTASVPVKFGSVNTSNGNLILSIPIASTPQRKGRASTISLTYNSSFWYQDGGAYNDPMVPGDAVFEGAPYRGMDLVSDVGPYGSVKFDASSEQCPNASSRGPTAKTTFKNFRIVDQYGGVVPFGGQLYEDWACGYVDVYPPETDSQGRLNTIGRHFNGPLYSMQIQAVPYGGGISSILVWDQSGNLIAGSTKDSNGNFSSDKDQLGREVMTRSCDNPAWVTQGGTCSISVLSSTGPVTYTIVYTLSPVCSNFTPVSGYALQQYCGNVVLPTSVTRPDNTQYTFTWDVGTDPGHYGTLTDIQLPEGGHLHYTYVMNAMPNNPIAVESVSDGHGTTSFAYTANTTTPAGLTGQNPSNSFTTTVYSPARYDITSKSTLLDKQVYTYGFYSQGSQTPLQYLGVGGSQGSILPILQQSQEYSGSTLLRTRLYNWSFPAPTSTPNNYNAEGIDDTGVHTVTTTLNDSNQASTTRFQYIPYTNLIQNLHEDVGAKDERTTITTYINDASNGSTAYNTAYHIYDRPTEITIYAGSSSSAPVVADTKYTYDEYSASYCGSLPMLQSVTGASQHDDSYDTSYVARGNVTTVSRLIAGSTYAISHSCYDTLGNVKQTVDPNGNATSFDYQDSWYDNACSVSNTYSLPTTITNAIGQATKRKYWSCSSLIAQSQDPNDLATSRTGTLSSFDFAGRSTQITYPDGGGTTTTYSDASSKVDKDTLLSGANSTSGVQHIKQTISLDDLGRTIQTQLTSDPAGTLYQDTSYDGAGRVYQKSNPYRGTWDKKYGQETFYYDGLGRTVQQTHADASLESWDFLGTSVTYTDADGNQWERTSDLLGRLSKVLEPSSTSQTPTLETDYTYDSLDNLTDVSQSGTTSETPRNRHFKYDSMSRLLWADNPETGVICYGHGDGTTKGCQNDGYDANGNLSYKTDARKITVHYTYDQLNRLVSKDYSDGTPSSAFQYDETAGWGAAGCGGSGFVQCNTIGRLSSMSTTNATGSIFSYDEMGRTTMKSSCVGSLCGSDRLDQFFTYDLAGNLTGYDHGTRGGSGVFFGGHGLAYDTAGHLTSATSFQNSNNSASMFQSDSYGPLGLLNSTLGNGLNETRSYDVRGRQQSYNAVSGSLPTSSTLAGVVDSFENDDLVRFPNIQIDSSAVPQNGYIDVNGWAANAQSCPIAAVEIDLDQTELGYATLGGARPDVQQGAYPNDTQHGSCGFSFHGSVGDASVGKHTLSAYAIDAAGNRSALGIISSTLTVTADQPPSGNVDGPASGQIASGGLVTVSGWAIDSQMHAPVGAVKILVDGSPVGYATLGVQRPDVASSLGDSRYASSGWTYTGSIGALSPGAHTVSTVVYDSGGQNTTLNPVSITVVSDPASVQGFIDHAESAVSCTSTLKQNEKLLVMGWAASEATTPACASNIGRVDVLVDGSPVGQATLGDTRTDVGSSLNNQACNNTGWHFVGGLTNVAPGSHIVSARLYDEDGGSTVLGSSVIQVTSQYASAASSSGLPSKYAWSLGFEENGNVSDSFDSINGNYSYLYDDLNRLVAAGSQSAGFQWTYDSFGNRTSQVLTQGTGTSRYDTYSVGANNRADAITYDAAGNALSIGGAVGIPMTYDGEGRLSSANGISYVYDAQGQRVAKSVNGSLTNAYLYDLDGHVVTELDGSFNVLRREVYAGARHLGTFDAQGAFTYVLSDWLGTERARADSTGTLCQTIVSQPYGDNQQVSGTCGSASPAFFTGKERDTESGLDYFGARYYGSRMGQFTSPDQLTLTDDRALHPTTTLNKYSYAGNNPVKYLDRDGNDITLFYDNTGTGHIGLAVYDPDTMTGRFESFGPAVSTHTLNGRFSQLQGNDASESVSDGKVDQFKNPDFIRNNYSSFTIQTDPETTQEVIQYLNTHADGNWNLYKNNCSHACARVLQKIGINLHPGLPSSEMKQLVLQRGSLGAKLTMAIFGFLPGVDYGNTRPGVDPFRMMELMAQHCVTTQVTVRDSTGGVRTTGMHQRCSH